MEDQKLNLGRRAFAKTLAGAAVASSVRTSRATVHPNPPGIKIATSASGNPTDEDLLFYQQAGVEYVSLPANPQSNAESFTKMRERYESAGIKVYNIGSGVGPSGSLHNMSEVTLNLPGRDQKIEEYKQYLRYLGKAGIHYTTYAHMGNGIWSSGRATIRGSEGRELDLASPNRRGNWAGKSWTEPLSHGRVFSKEEIWDNYTYFIKQVAPVAEEAGVRIGIHPDDPPQPMLGGVPRCIFSNFEGYKRALEIANSPNIGVCLCCGSWMEGGTMTGKDVVGMIDYFGRRKKLFKIHFRNVSAPLPHFTETLIDDGYTDMSKVMQALVDVDFDGIMIPDHIPALGVIPGTDAGRGGGAGRGTPGQFRPNVGLAYLIGCMHSMLKGAQNHKK